MEKNLDLKQPFQQEEVEEDVRVGVAAYNLNLSYLCCDLFPDLAMQSFSYYLQQTAVDLFLLILLTGLKRSFIEVKGK